MDSGSVGARTGNLGADTLARCRGGAIAIGNFDGVHRGHAVLLRRLCEMAGELGGPSVAITFDPHPARLLRPESAPVRLTSMELRAERMNSLGVDVLMVCPTTPDLLQLSAEDFFQRLVIDRLQARGMVEGPNFFFGRDRAGNVETLQRLTRQSGIELSIVDAESVTAESSGDQMVSSSLIRDRLRDGNVKEVISLSGFPHRVEGVVGSGAKRGRQIGFPTANLTQIDVALPANGVYAGHAWVDGVRHGAAVHLGPNPTFEDDHDVKVEVHLLDYAGDLYNKMLGVDFLERVRDIRKFDSSDQLKAQLNIDLMAVREILGA